MRRAGRLVVGLVELVVVLLILALLAILVMGAVTTQRGTRRAGDDPRENGPVEVDARLVGGHRHGWRGRREGHDGGIFGVRGHS